MKTFLTSILFMFIFLIFSEKLMAQAPALIGYQGTVRNDKGVPVINQAISLRFEILKDSQSGPVVYTDDQLTGLSTNGQGLFTTQIGKNGTLNQLDWQQSQLFFLRISIDPTGGNNLIVLGNPQQMVSVPYALHASSVPASYTNNVLTVGTKSFIITMTPNTSITVSGLGTVTSTGTNSFDINIPSPTFSNTGQTIISGNYPNYTVNTPTVPAAITPSIGITNTNAATSTVVSSGSSFSINVPPPTFSNTGQTIISGNYPNYTVNTPTVPAAITPSIGITNTNAATSTVVSSGSSFSINVPPPTFSNTGQTIITGTYPNYNVNTPTVAATSIAITATAAAGPSVSTSGNSFNINVPPATFTNSGPTTIIGTSPNFTVSSAPIVTYTNGTGISITSGSVISNTAPNITPTVAITATAASGPSVSSVGSSFNINFPPPLIALSATAAAGPSVSSSGTSYSLNFPPPVIALSSTAGAGPSISNTGNNFNINIPAATTPSIYGAGIASVSPATGYNFTVSVAQPTFAYSQSNGSLTSGTSAAFITPNLSFIGNTLSSGPASNSVNLSSISPWAANGGTVFLTTPLNFVGIGTGAPHAPLQFTNSIANRKIVMWESANNDHQFYGFGINNSMLRYQVDNSVADHVFYAGASAATSNELFRIKGSGLIKMGTETGTAEGPLYPSGGGMMMRRIFTSLIAAGSVVARTDQVIFERDGTNAGFRVNRTGGSTLLTCNCMGTNAAGASINRAYNNLVSGITQVFTNAENVVYFHCMFGDPYNAGHISEVTLMRQAADYYWIGTIISTFNQ